AIINPSERVFEAVDAVRDTVPLLTAFTSPSSAGKTKSALRCATGMQEVTGGDIYFLDTESKRAKHYADEFKFKHVEFGAPFGSLDYLAAIRYCAARTKGPIVVDSMSHEHAGVGGYLEYHAAELERLDKDNRKGDRNNFTAYIKPSAARRKLLN